MSNKLVVIIAGPNGAGKTSFAQQYLPDEVGIDSFVNADLIAAGISPLAPEKEAIRAGKMMLNAISRLAEIGESFGFETTLSATIFARMIPNWQIRGYRVRLIFLSLPSVELAIERVRARVISGGHAIPEVTIRRRFGSGLRNFHSLYKPLVDDWILSDNSDTVSRVVEREGTGMNDIMKSEAALRRAGMRALWLGKRLGVPVMVFRDGQIIDAAKTDPEPTEEQMRRPGAASPRKGESENGGMGEK